MALRAYAASLLLPTSVLLSGCGEQRASFDLPFGDVNVMIVTDVHSWIAGHKHEPKYDANYGDVLSLYELMKQDCDRNARDLFFVMNGDINDGTGLSTDPPVELVPLLQRMPWDAVTIGNHELYKNEFIEYLTKPDGFIPFWGDRYLTANVVNATTGTPLGRTHKFLRGTHGTTLLTLGFLYEMTDAGSAVKVLKAEDVVQAQWFQDLLAGKEGGFDAVMILGHMDYQDPWVDVLLQAIRAIQPTMPVQFVTGHSHRREYADLDAKASSFEAGHYLDTVGFASFPKNDTAEAQAFQHVFIDASKQAFASVAGGEVATDAGRALTKDIAEARARMGLSQRLGCAPMSYDKYAALNETDSLWKVFLDGPINETLFGGDQGQRKAMLASTGSMRYNLYEGNVTKDDIVTMMPFADEFFLIAHDLPGETIASALAELNNGSSYALPDWVSTEFDPNNAYDLYGGTFDVGTVERPGKLLKKLLDLTGAALAPEQRFIGKTSTNLWYDYVPTAWPCDSLVLV